MLSEEQLIDKYSEVLDDIAENLIAICLYPDNPTVHHWRERVSGLCKRFTNQNINPLKRNTYDVRLKYLCKAVDEVFDKDFGALYNHFRSVVAYYSNRPNTHDNLVPYDKCDVCYEEQKERVKEGIMTLTKMVARQDYDALLKYIEQY